PSGCMTAEEAKAIPPPSSDASVMLCHLPPGNHAAAHTIVVGSEAVNAHLSHGDTLGVCNGSAPDAGASNSEEDAGVPASDPGFTDDGCGHLVAPGTVVIGGCCRTTSQCYSGMTCGSPNDGWFCYPSDPNCTCVVVTI